MPTQPHAQLVCQSSGCGALLQRCENRELHQVCIGTVLAGSEQSRCRYCALNRVVPDLTNVQHVEHWRRLEQAKHRVLFGIEQLGFEIAPPTTPGLPALAFAFKGDAAKPVFTGHSEGLITINIEEADSVERERNRVQFNEPKRTLVAHFRHELGHYFWDRLVKPSALEACRELFGDERAPTYVEAKETYYQQGPPTNWQFNTVSQYASMHPWEDFAETFRVYTEMAAFLATTASFDIFDVDQTSFASIQESYLRCAIYANELNREVGLIDPGPERFPNPVLAKLEFIHNLRPSST